MKVAYFNWDFAPTLGGMAEVASTLAENMAKDPAISQVAVVALKNPKPRQVVREKLTINALASGSLFGMFFTVIKYAWQYRKFDIFHSTDLFPVGFFVLLVGKYFLGKKVIINVYGTDALANKGLAITRKIKGWVLKNADRVIVVSKSSKKQISASYNIAAEKLEVVYVGINDGLIASQPKKIRKDLGLSEEDFVVLSVGRLIKRKGIDDLIKAIDLTDDSSIKLLIVGDGPEKEKLIELASTMDLSSRIIFAGKVDSTVDYYFSADVFSMPSKYLVEDGDIEGLGIVFLEAQHFGLPVIGTFSGGIPEAIIDGKTGFLVPESDPKSLAEKIIFLKEHPEVYREFSAAGREFVERNFSWPVITKQLIKIYQEKVL